MLLDLLSLDLKVGEGVSGLLVAGVELLDLLEVRERRSVVVVEELLEVDSHPQGHINWCWPVGDVRLNGERRSEASFARCWQDGEGRLPYGG